MAQVEFPSFDPQPHRYTIGLDKSENQVSFDNLEKFDHI